jgi:hypothetical protein
MSKQTKNFPAHVCQHCGTERKLVEIIIDDEFCWNEKIQQYEPNKFMDDFEHTGNVWCAICKKEWTGV